MGWGPPFSNHPKSVSGPIIKLQCQLKWMSRIKDPIYLSLAEKKTFPEKESFISFSLEIVFFCRFNK